MKLDIAEDVPTALILDEVRLNQILINLIGNALKFTSSGYIRLAMKVEFTESTHSTPNLIISVCDTGIGIPSESLDQIFTKFYRVPDQGETRPEGTGLGLHISRRIIEAHGGRIWAESTMGEGSTFRLALPCGEKNEGNSQ